MQLHPNIHLMNQLLAELSQLDENNLLLVEPSDNRDTPTVVVRCASKNSWADVMIYPDKFEVIVFSKEDGYLETFNMSHGMQNLAEAVYDELIYPQVV